MNAFILLNILIMAILFTNIPPANSHENMNIPIKYINKFTGIKEYQLNNGIKVLLKQNHTIPLVTFSVWYKVGSRNENDNTRGLAHFLEHMMFKGTKKHKKGEISELIQLYGGIFNAFTSTEGTAYYETISPKYLEKVIEIESDRMKNSLLNEDELNLERTVVLSELEGDLNNPTTLLDQKLRWDSYESSPYKHPTIGYKETIEKINSKTMRDFYKTFYNPNNSTILLVGDFNERSALNLINNYFGKIKNATVTKPSVIQEKKQTKEKRFTITKNGSFKILEIAYHICDVKNQDIYPLNVIEELLLRGKKGRLIKALVEKGLATEVYGGAEANTDPGLFYILVSLTPASKHKAVEKIILNEINQLLKYPLSEEELKAAKNRIKANYLYNLDGTFNQALNIGYFELVNNWKQSQNWINNIDKVNLEDIQIVLKKYFIKENKTTGYFIPKLRKGEKYEPQPLSVSQTHNYTQTQNTSLPASNSTNNKKLFKYTTRTLKSNSKLLIYNDIDLPVTYISGVMKGGSSLLSKNREWECELIARTIEKGTSRHTKEEIEDFLDSTGSQINFSCDEESFKFTLVSLNENIDQTLKLLLEILHNPSFEEKEVEREKKKLIAEIIESKDNTQEIAKRRLYQIIYPENHPYYANTFEKDISQVKKITSKSLHESHNQLIKNNNAIITILSNSDKDRIAHLTNLIEDSLSSKNIKQKEANIPDTLLRDSPKTESILIKGKLQSDVFLGHAGFLKRTDPDFYKMHLANYILGGSMLTSRLAKKVRDNSGLVYTIYSYFNASLGKGEFGIYFGSNNSNVDQAINLIKDEVTKFVKYGITEEELTKAKASLIDSFTSRNLSTYKSIANTLSGIEFYDLGENYINEYPKIVSSLTVNEINKTIKKYIFPDKLNVTIAGEYNPKK